MVRPCAHPRGRPGAVEHGAGPAGPGARPADACGQARRPGPRRGPAGLSARRAAVPESGVDGVAARRFRLHADAQLCGRDLAAAAVAGAGEIQRCRGGGHRRQGGQGSPLSPAACGRLGGAPGRRHGGVCRPHAGRADQPVALLQRAVRHRCGRHRRSRPGPGPRLVRTQARLAGYDGRGAGRCRPGLPKDSAYQSQGRVGMHSEHMGHLLAELQYLQRAFPGGKW